MLLLLAVLTAIPGAARALEFRVEDNGRALTLSGEIEAEDDERFARLLAGPVARFTSVRLNSPGGSLAAGIEIGRQIRQRRMATLVQADRKCASACVHMFLGGAVREVHPAGAIGVHMASLMNSDEYVEALKRVLDNPKFDLDTKVRAIISLNEQNGAVAAGVQAMYLVEMGVSLRLLEPSIATKHYRMHWLTRQELRDYNVVNVD
jgi:hypothetical protein